MAVAGDLKAKGPMPCWSGMGGYQASGWPRSRVDAVPSTMLDASVVAANDAAEVELSYGGPGCANTPGRAER